MRTLVIRHVAFEDLGAWETPLRARGPVEVLDAGIDPFDRDPNAADLVVVLGGPIGVYETELYPFLREEIDFVGRRMQAERPTLGVCLGAQIMAAAAGARVYPGPAKEIGFLPIALSEAGRASPLAPFAEAPMAMHWHGDTFDLPSGGALLASTEAVTNQAFAIGPRLFGVQFHPEANLASFERWLIGHRAELGYAGVDVAGLRAEAARHAQDLSNKAVRVLERYLEAAGLQDGV
ncbi:MAG: glutamine amidotransferase [Hyphomonadaceae bacterium]|nr:glutamine amidotransferase [Hyphomonadaceae bacterium]